ncbi:MAG: YeeE/YedE family protein [Betaproteobacteria bacterium]|nr:YeeE/YedE family protein [Betaproteobacteria bacterium]
METPSSLPALVAWLAFALAFVFGAAAQRCNFCTMGAITDVVNFGEWRRMRMWLLAIAVAILGANALWAAGQIDLSKSLYVSNNLIWLAHLVGGLLFGFGMTLASGCGSRTLIRLGAGNLKSLIVIVFLALAAYMTLRGALALLRVNVFEAVRWDLGRAQDLPTLLGALGLAGPVARWLVPAVIGVALLIFVFKDREFRATTEYVIGGLVVGAVIVAGWYVSAHIGYMAEDPNTLQEAFVATNSGRPESYSFTSPVAYLLELLIFWTDKSKIMTFGIAGVLGMAAGAAAMALATKTFRWEGFNNTEDLVNHIVGGLLMGFGGVLALGCTIGQGLTGISTLAVGSFLSFFAIVGGCVAAVKYQEWRIDRM